MERNRLLEECKTLCNIFPQLVIRELETEIRIEGTLVFNAEYNNVPLSDSYNIRMQIYFDFPRSIPFVWELDGKIPKDFMHFLHNNALCLGIQTEIALSISQNPSLVYFINTYVVNYLYAATYFIKYGTMPFGERAHGIDGIIDYYKEILNVDTKEKVLGILEIICLGRIPRHYRCPCGSNKNIRHCWHGDIIINLINSGNRGSFKNDLLALQEHERNKYGKIRPTKRRI